MSVSPETLRVWKEEYKTWRSEAVRALDSLYLGPEGGPNDSWMSEFTGRAVRIMDELIRQLTSRQEQVIFLEHKYGEAKERLAKYAQHLPHCATVEYRDGTVEKCSCGLE